MKNDLVVVVPFFNEERYLEKSLQSLSDQTFKLFDVLLIDDCSTDNSAMIAKAFCEKDTRFIYVYNEVNIGVTASINKHLNLHQYNYVARHDADDISISDRLAIQYNFFRDDGEVAVVGSDFCISNERDRTTYQVRNCFPKFLLKSVFNITNVVNTGTTMWRSRCLREIGGFKNTDGKVEGYSTIKCLLDHGLQFHILPELLYIYFIHEEKSHRSHQGSFSKRNAAMQKIAKTSNSRLQFFFWRNVNFISALLPKFIRNILIGRVVRRVKFRSYWR